MLLIQLLLTLLLLLPLKLLTNQRFNVSYSKSNKAVHTIVVSFFHIYVIDITRYYIYDIPDTR